MGMWILSFCLIAIEGWGAVYFFDIFMERKRKGWLDKCRYIVLLFICTPVAVLGGHFDVMGIKVLLVVLAYMAFCASFYQADWKQCIFFSVLNYSLLFVIDIFSLLVENILNSRDKLYALEHDLLYLPMKLSWILLLFILRRIQDRKSVV